MKSFFLLGWARFTQTCKKNPCFVLISERWTCPCVTQSNYVKWDQVMQISMVLQQKTTFPYFSYIKWLSSYTPPNDHLMPTLTSHNKTQLNPNDNGVAQVLTSSISLSWGKKKKSPELNPYVVPGIVLSIMKWLKRTPNSILFPKKETDS